MKLLRILTICTATIALAACGTTTSSAGASDTANGDAGGDTSDSAGIYGTYSSNFGGYEEISPAMWNETTIVKLDATARVAITQNPANDKYNPSQFSKTVWTAPAGGSFYYCTVDYGLASADLASASTKTADASAPDSSGCSGFSWTKLTSTAPIAIAGKYNDNFGDKPVISSRWWDATWMQKFDNDKRYAIVQSPADDPYTPSKFSKNVWTAPVAGTFYFCTVDYGLDTADLAEATTKTADDSAPDTAGCGGFAWTKLTPQ